MPYIFIMDMNSQIRAINLVIVAWDGHSQVPLRRLRSLDQVLANENLLCLLSRGWVTFFGNCYLVSFLYTNNLIKKLEKLQLSVQVSKCSLVKIKISLAFPCHLLNLIPSKFVQKVVPTYYSRWSTIFSNTT